MNIKEVEQRTGLRKANIRYYEQEGLLKPKRNAQNNYREYSQEDIDVLNRIRLLRLLEVPVQEILKFQAGKITVSELMEEREKQLAEEIRRREEMKELCGRIKRSGAAFEELDPSVQESDSFYYKWKTEKIRRLDVARTLEDRAFLLHRAILLAMLLYWAVYGLYLFSGAALPAGLTIVFLVLDLGMLAVWTGIKLKIHRLKMK